MRRLPDHEVAITEEKLGAVRTEHAESFMEGRKMTICWTVHSCYPNRDICLPRKGDGISGPVRSGDKKEEPSG